MLKHALVLSLILIHLPSYAGEDIIKKSDYMINSFRFTQARDYLNTELEKDPRNLEIRSQVNKVRAILGDAPLAKLKKPQITIPVLKSSTPYIKKVSPVEVGREPLEKKNYASPETKPPGTITENTTTDKADASTHPKTIVPIQAADKTNYKKQLPSSLLKSFKSTPKSKTQTAITPDKKKTTLWDYFK